MQIGILGGSVSQFGELWQVSPRFLARDIVGQAIADSGLALDAIEAIYVGNMLSGMLGGQENLGAFFAAELGLRCPAFKIEGACASGGLAVHTAINGIRGGMYKTALVIGIEKMTDYGSDEVAAALMGAGSDEERKSGITFAGLYALIAQQHREKYGTTEQQMAAVAVKNHFHASLNPKAHFQSPLTIEKVMRSALVADPLKLFDCSPVSDGVAAVVLADESMSKKRAKPVWVAASAVATDTLSLTARHDLTTLQAASDAARVAYKQAGVTPNDIAVAEVHDCFTIAEIVAMEDLGFYEKGKAASGIERFETMLGKRKPFDSAQGRPVVNPSGGLKGCGHPVGATGVKQIVEIMQQLRGQSGKRQVPDARIGLTHNVGGSGAVAVVHILRS